MWADSAQLVHRAWNFAKEAVVVGDGTRLAGVTSPVTQQWAGIAHALPDVLVANAVIAAHGVGKFVSPAELFKARTE